MSLDPIPPDQIRTIAESVPVPLVGSCEVREDPSESVKRRGIFGLDTRLPSAQWNQLDQFIWQTQQSSPPTRPLTLLFGSIGYKQKIFIFLKLTFFIFLCFLHVSKYQVSKHVELSSLIFWSTRLIILMHVKRALP